MNLLGIIILILTLIVVFVVAIFLVTGLTGAPYVPTLKPGLRKALTDLYKISEKDLLLDLGAGDGVVLEEAAKLGAKALGVELNPILTLIMKRRFRKNKNVTVKCRNFYRFKFPKETTVVYTFAVSLHIKPIYKKIKKEATRLNKTLYFISNAFDLPDLKPEKKISTFYLYKITPEKSK